MAYGEAGDLETGRQFSSVKQFMNIKILCAKVNPKALRLQDLFKDYGNVEIIAHNNIQLNNYRGLNRIVNCEWVTVDTPDKIAPLVKQNPFLKIVPDRMDGFQPFKVLIPNTNAWDLAFKDIEVEDTLFIEDDVATNLTFIEPFFSFINGAGNSYDYIATDIELRAESVWWPHWDSFLNISSNDRKGFNPFCVLRKSLVQEILDFKEKHGSFVFHEILFPTLAKNPYDFKLNKQFNLLFYRYRMKGVIYTPYLYRSLVHPVKDDIEHKKICDNTGEEVEIIIK